MIATGDATNTSRRSGVSPGGPRGDDAAGPVDTPVPPRSPVKDPGREPPREEPPLKREPPPAEDPPPRQPPRRDPDKGPPVTDPPAPDEAPGEIRSRSLAQVRDEVPEIDDEIIENLQQSGVVLGDWAG